MGHNWANYVTSVPDNLYRPIIGKPESKRYKYGITGPQFGQSTELPWEFWTLNKIIIIIIIIPVPDNLYRPIIGKPESEWYRHGMTGPQLGQL